MLKEQTRRYKQRTQDAERQAERHEQKLQSLSDCVRKLKAQLAEGACSPEAAAAAEQQLRQQVEAAAKALEVGLMLQQLLDDACCEKQDRGVSCLLW